jgi:hypothetical protein
MTEYTLTDANVGDVLPITDGFLVSLSMTQRGVSMARRVLTRASKSGSAGISSFAEASTFAISFVSRRNPAAVGDRMASWSPTTALVIAASCWSSRFLEAALGA